MADLTKYEVARDHLGDNYVTAGNGEVSIVATNFRKGDTRIAPSDVVKSIVGTVLVDPAADQASADQAAADQAAADKAAADQAAADKAAADQAAADQAAADQAAADQAAADQAAADAVKADAPLANKAEPRPRNKAASAAADKAV